MLITKATYLISSPSVDKCPKPDRPEYAFIGRSNVGKSSLINLLCNNSKLAKISVTPGKTQLINHYTIESTTEKSNKKTNWYLVDLPGYGYAAASAAERVTWAPMTTALAARASLRGLFLIVDSRRGLLAGDEGLIAWAAAVRCPVHVLLSKTDKLKRAELSRALTLARQALAGRATAQAFSAVDGTGLEEARRQLHQWFQKIKGPGG